MTTGQAEGQRTTMSNLDDRDPRDREGDDRDQDASRPAAGDAEARLTQPGAEIPTGSTDGVVDEKKSDGRGQTVGNYHNRIAYQLIAENLVFTIEGAGAGPEFSADSRTDEDEAVGEDEEARRNARSRSRREYRFEDPTLPFPQRIGALKYRFDEHDIGNWSRLLAEHRLIGVRSPADDITSAAVHALLDVDRRSHDQIRLLAFGPRNQGREDLFFENLIGQPLGDPETPTILVVDAHGALPFIESTLGGEDWARAMADALRQEDTRVIVKMAAGYRLHLADKLGGFHFPLWDVDFLRPLLYRYFPEDRVGELAARIARQRREGFWGPDHDDVYLFDALQPLLSGGVEKLEEVLEAREQSRPLPALPSAVEAFESRYPIYQAILVCAAFFRGLDVTEFARLVFGLVGDETVFVKDGELQAGGKVALATHRRRLREAWPRVGDDLLEDCGLVIRTTNGNGTVDFSRPGERSALQAHVRASVYFSNISETLWSAGHLFDPDASLELVDGATNVFAEAIVHHGEWRRPQWLCETLLDRLSDGESADVTELLKRIARDSLVIGRLSQLLRALVGRSSHLDLVQSWLGHLIARRGHLPALQLIMHLRYAEGFDYLFWLKRLSDESPDDVRNAAYSALYRHARQSSVRIWDFLEELETWLPEPDKPEGALSNSNNFALQLIIEYAVDTAEMVPPSEYGAWPSRYPLFRGLAQEPASADERLSSLVAWLFHRGIRTVFRENADDLAWLVRARLLELWSCLLLGLDGEGVHMDAQATYRLLLELFWERSGRDGRHRMVRIWRDNRDHLLAERSRKRERSVYLTQRIELSYRLERDFKAASGTI